MNKLIYLFFIIFITFLSCDGRGRIHKSNEEVLIENKLLDSFSENTVFIPETYFERTIDTIFSNGITSKMTFYSDMENGVSIEEVKDSITYKTIFRDIVVDVEINSKNKPIFNGKIDKSYLVKKGVFDKEEIELFGIKDFDISSYDDVKDGYPILTLHYAHIESSEIKIIRFYFLEDNPIFEIIT